MNCKQSEEAFMRYFDHLSNDVEIAAIKQHIKSCQRCAQQFDQMDDILGSLEHVEEIAIPKEFEKDVMFKVSSYALLKQEKSRKFQAILVIAMLFVSSAPLVAFGTAFLSLNPFQVILDVGGYIGNLYNLWSFGSVFVGISGVLFAGLDLFIKAILAATVMFMSLAIIAKIKSLKHEMRLN